MVVLLEPTVVEQLPRRVQLATVEMGMRPASLTTAPLFEREGAPVMTLAAL